MMKIVSGKHNTSEATGCQQSRDHDPLVLIVDDDPGVVDVLQEFLEEEGFTVMYAENGRRALHKIESRQPDIVLADMRMPVMDGQALLSEISDRWVEINVIMMSATESPAGLNVPFIQKPFDLDDVYSTICDCNSAHDSTS